jgi:DNA-directed RNA polymerase subunit RPC12/RpoP
MVRDDGGMADATVGRLRDLRCDTCGAPFARVEAVMEHLVDAYHGFQCLRCGALFAQRRQLDEHDCPGC